MTKSLKIRWSGLLTVCLLYVLINLRLFNVKLPTKVILSDFTKNFILYNLE